MQGSHEGCEPGESVAPFMGLADWSQLDAAILDTSYNALSFFFEGGFRYFLPVYLIADLMDRSIVPRYWERWGLCRILILAGRTHLADFFFILIESLPMPVETFIAQVESVTHLTHDVCELDLRLIEPQAITFKSGQFISFEMPHPQTGRLMTRAYSIASQPSRPDVITLLFNLVPGGAGSGFLFDLKVGDKTVFKGPTGSFYLREDSGRQLLFIASGTGITPIRSMLLANAERPDPRPATLFWGLRSQRDLYYQKELAELTRRSPTCTVVTTLSRPEPGWSGPSGRVLRLIEARIASVKDLAVYLCGNSAMIAEAKLLLQQKGLCPIYREKYYDDTGSPED